MTNPERVEAVSGPDVERRVREHLSGTDLAPRFKQRIITRKFGRIWVVRPAAGHAVGPWIYADSRGTIRRVDFTSPTQRLLRIIALVVLFIGLALLVSRFYPKRWCATDVTASGATIQICRDPEVTDPAIVALGVVILAALGVFYTEISGFGLTFRRRVDEAESKARESLRQVNDLQEVRKFIQETQADFADTNSRTDERLVRLERAIYEIQNQLDRSGQPSPSTSSTTGDGNGPSRTGPTTGRLNSDEVLRHAAEYNRCRSTMVAGPARSTRMEKIFSDMRAAVKSIRASDSEIKRAMSNSSDDRGIRLTAYAYLIEHPVPDLVEQLINLAAEEDKPFGQYCALRAVNRLVETSKARLTPEMVERLNEIAVTAGHGTDRAREVAGILAADRRKPHNTV